MFRSDHFNGIVSFSSFSTESEVRNPDIKTITKMIALQLISSVDRCLTTQSSQRDHKNLEFEN